jgi:hypothetical protein
MAPPKDFDYAKFKKVKPKSVVEDPKLRVNMTFLHNHYIHYPKLSKSSKVDKVMYDRVNMLRQMVAGLKKTRESINNMFKGLSATDKDHQKFKLVLMQYIELLRKAERDRQKWIKDEVKLGNTKHVQELLVGPGLDDVVRI